MPTPAPPPPTTSAKKGFTQYLSYPTPSMQAFVGSYIAPLVPKFRVEAKSIAVVKENGRAPGEAVEKGKKKKEEEEVEKKKEEESARKLLLTQREKVRLIALFIYGLSTGTETVYID